MRPRATREDGGLIAPGVTVLIVERRPGASADVFRHIVRKTHDLYERYEAGLRMLASAYYQDPGNFSGVMAALFSTDSRVAAALVEEGRCLLHFEQNDTGYCIPCGVGELREDDPVYESTYWHNHLFNPAPLPAIRMLAFYPEWAGATVKQITDPESRVTGKRAMSNEQ
jgi:hypothetical protein